MTVAVVSVSARGRDEVSVSLEIREGDAVQRESFLLSASAFADLHLAVGECGRETFDAVSSEAERYGAVKAGLSVLSYGAHSKRSLCRKLTQKGFSAAVASEAAGRLAELGYIDEDADALREAQRCVAKLWGRKRICAHLYEKGYSEESVRKALYSLEDDGVDFAEVCADRLRQSSRALPKDPKELQKLVASLMRYGFSGSEIKEAMREIQGDK